MKNYIVMAVRQFSDYEGLETIPTNPCVQRKINDIFKCTKERYEYLKQNNAVVLKGIEKQTKKK
jgi:hypothetical protein